MKTFSDMWEMESELPNILFRKPLKNILLKTE